MDEPVAWLIDRANGTRDVVLSPLTDDTFLDEGDEAIALYTRPAPALTEERIREIAEQAVDRMDRAGVPLSRADDVSWAIITALAESSPDRVSVLSEPTDMKIDEGCICRGNWRNIVAEYEAIPENKQFLDEEGNVFTLFGVVHSDDDYYYGMWDHKHNVLQLLSCVGSIENHGFVPLSAARGEG